MSNLYAEQISNLKEDKAALSQNIFVMSQELKQLEDEQIELVAKKLYKEAGEVGERKDTVKKALKDVRISLNEIDVALNEMEGMQDKEDAGLNSSNTDDNSVLAASLSAGPVSFTNLKHGTMRADPEPVPEPIRIETPEDKEAALSEAIEEFKQNILEHEDVAENLAAYKKTKYAGDIVEYFAYWHGDIAVVFGAPNAELFCNIEEMIPDSGDQMDTIESSTYFGPRVCANPPMFLMTPEEIKRKFTPGFLAAFTRKVYEASGYNENLTPTVRVD